jgi:hypothetical protein
MGAGIGGGSGQLESVEGPGNAYQARERRAKGRVSRALMDFNTRAPRAGAEADPGVAAGADLSVIAQDDFGLLVPRSRKAPDGYK